MILLDHIVHVRGPLKGPPTSAVPAQSAGVFSCSICDRVRRVPIDVDNTGLNPPGLCDGKLEKALRRKGIAIWREQEINGVAGRVDGPIQICSPTGNTDEGFVDPPRAVPDSAFQTGSAGSGPERIRAPTERWSNDRSTAHAPPSSPQDCGS